MIKGGYKIINLGDVNLITGSATTIPGIYDSFKNSHRKAIMLSGITIDGYKRADTFINYFISDIKCSFTIYSKTFTITNENKVTIG